MRRLAGLISLLIFVSGCYVTRLGLRQNDLFNSRRPVADVQVDPKTPEKTREGLRHVAAIMAYAREQGLNTDGAYDYFVQTEGRHVSYLVQAANPLNLTFVTWWFPVVGSVPYRGYFDERERNEKAEELKAEGYDVVTGGVGAFSSLGWFDDPIFTSMVLRKEADIAHLFLHELTHRTIWIPGSVLFNENMAEYVATDLTVAYLERSGASKTSKEAIRAYNDKRADRLLFKDWLALLKADLEELYGKKADLSEEAILFEKRAIFERYQREPLKPKFKRVDFVRGETWNNAAVLANNLYSPDLERFAKAHECAGMGLSMIAFISRVAEQVDDQGGDPFEALDSLCDRKPVAAVNPEF